jgi:hypothetical protein
MLTLNSRSEAFVTPADEGSFPVQKPDQLRIVVNRSFFESKVKLLEIFRFERERLLPQGIVLGARGIDVNGRSGNQFSIVAHVEIHLKSLKGLTGTAAALVEKVAGNTDGIFRLPLQVDLRPEVMEIGTERFLRLYLAMDENFVKNSFGDRSNLAAASTLLADKIKEKLHEAALKMKANPIDVDLAPLESKAPIKVSRVVFSDQGSLAIDVELVSFRGVIKKKSKATSEGASP